jgi:6-aminohexanoate-oligomer endohydrolase
MQDSVLTAGALAVASGIDRKDAMAQDDSTPVAPAVAGRVLEFDVPGLEIGVAAYPEIPTGCTVFNFDVATFPDGVMLELDVRGGAPWHSGAEDIVNANSLAGGSVYGLEAAAGVSSELFAQGGTAIW